MAKIKWEAKLAVVLIALSILMYALHFALFHDFHHIFIYFVGDVAFIPIEVLMVTLIIHRLLEQRDRKQKLEKLNIVIGAFFSEVGTKLLMHLSDCDPNLDDIRGNLIIENDWNDAEFSNAYDKLRNYPYDLDIDKVELFYLRQYLSGKREFLVRLLENPTMLEHESFTGLLQSVFHALEELESRDDLNNLPKSDLEHLRGDLKRSYMKLVNEWLDYMRHLQRHYPYLFSLAMRLNPFDSESSPVVQ